MPTDDSEGDSFTKLNQAEAGNKNQACNNGAGVLVVKEAFVVTCTADYRSQAYPDPDLGPEANLWEKLFSDDSSSRLSSVILRHSRP